MITQYVHLTNIFMSDRGQNVQWNIYMCYVRAKKGQWLGNAGRGLQGYMRGAVVSSSLQYILIRMAGIILSMTQLSLIQCSLSTYCADYSAMGFLIKIFILKKLQKTYHLLLWEMIQRDASILHSVPPMGTSYNCAISQPGCWH